MELLTSLQTALRLDKADVPVSLTFPTPSGCSAAHRGVVQVCVRVCGGWGGLVHLPRHWRSPAALQSSPATPEHQSAPAPTFDRLDPPSAPISAPPLAFSPPRQSPLTPHPCHLWSWADTPDHQHQKWYCTLKFAAFHLPDHALIPLKCLRFSPSSQPSALSCLSRGT